jgi:hypothetical protein
VGWGGVQVGVQAQDEVVQVVGALRVHGGVGVVVVLCVVGGDGQQRHDPAQDTVFRVEHVIEDLAGFVGAGCGEVFGEWVDPAGCGLGESDGEGTCRYRCSLCGGGGGGRPGLRGCDGAQAWGPRRNGRSW